MARIDLRTAGALVPLRPWSVVGTRNRNDIIRHVALLANDLDVRSGDSVSVRHMGPPITAFRSPSHEEEDDPTTWGRTNPHAATSSDQARVDCAGWLEDLSNDESREMERWYRTTAASFPESVPSPPRLRPGYERKWADYLSECRYIVHPPVEEKVDPFTGRTKGRRYSCAGFVLNCYESNVVEQSLVSRSSKSFPTVSVDVIEDTYLLGLKLIPELAEVIGLTAPDPWPIVMPGYVVKAFDRPDNEVRTAPYTPKQNDMKL